MFSETAEYYDIIYSKFKNYDLECEKIIALLDRLKPDTKNILDVACGTGEHLKILSQRSDYVLDGLDINPVFVKIAQKKNPKSTLFLDNMTDFKLNKKYDIVMCLFSSIGYVQTMENVVKTLKNFKTHLNEGGLILVEPWFTPERWNPGMTYADSAETEDIKIARMSHSDKKGNISIVNFEYLLATKEGIQHLKETHELGLFTHQELLSCFKEADLSVEFDSEGLFGRGIYIARSDS